MTRETAINKLNWALDNNTIEDVQSAYEYIIALKMAIKALEQTRWISCTERLPEDGDTYLVTIEYNGKVIGVDAASYSPVEGYIDKHWDTFNDWKEDEDSCYHVTAWMPLPGPYAPNN